jgi:hypothetical protein
MSTRRVENNAIALEFRCTGNRWFVVLVVLCCLCEKFRFSTVRFIYSCAICFAVCIKRSKAEVGQQLKIAAEQAHRYSML